MTIEAGKIPESLAGVHWHHSVELPDGTVIQGWKPLEVMKQQYEHTFGPLTLSGKSVLDLGTWNGAFAVEAARRGAGKVTAADSVIWSDPQFRAKDTFNFLTASWGLDIKSFELDLDESPNRLSDLGTFDIILLLGVFYHLKDPIAVLRELGKMAREALVVETYIATELPEEPPAMIFYPGSELTGDPTNWWGPNVACVRDLLKMAGFARVEIAQGSAYNRFIFHAFR